MTGQSWLARLKRAYVAFRQADAQPSAEPEKIRKLVSDFADIMVQRMPGSRSSEVAPWMGDRHEYVRHVKGSSYVAIGAVAKRCAMVEPEVSRVNYTAKGGKAEEQLPETHPVKVLFREVNPIHTLYDLIYYTVGWRIATGDSYVWKVRNGFNYPVELWPLPSQYVHAVPDTELLISGYRVDAVFGQTRTLDAGDVIHLSEPNLDWSNTGRYYGKSVFERNAEMIDSEEHLISRVYSQLRNLAPPGMVFSGAEGISDEQIMELYSILSMQHSLASQTGRPMVVPTGFELLDKGDKFNQMDYGKQLTDVLDWNLSIYGVPKAVVGMVNDLNRANTYGALLAFAENTVNPLLLHMSQHYSQDFSREWNDNLVVRFPPITVDDAEQLRRNYDTAARAGACTPDEIREALLSLPAYEAGGDRPLVPQTMAAGKLGNISQSVLDAEKQADEEAKQAERDAASAMAAARMGGGPAGKPAAGGKPGGNGQGKPGVKPQQPGPQTRQRPAVNGQPNGRGSAQAKSEPLTANQRIDVLDAIFSRLAKERLDTPGDDLD